MSTAMYDAREALIPGSVYDRSSTGELYPQSRQTAAPVSTETANALTNISTGPREARHGRVPCPPREWPPLGKKCVCVSHFLVCRASIKHVLSDP